MYFYLLKFFVELNKKIDNKNNLINISGFYYYNNLKLVTAMATARARQRRAGGCVARGGAGQLIYLRCWAELGGLL